MFRCFSFKSFVFVLLVILTLATSVNSALANNGYLGGQGGSGYPLDLVYPQQSADVVMEEELVQIWLYADGYEVSSQYIFRNEGSDQVVRMGFPSVLPRVGFYNPKTRDNSDDELQYFQAYADGRPIASVTKFGRSFDAVDDDPRQWGENGRGDIRWYVQEVPFTKDQRRLVTTKYAANYNYAPGDDQDPNGAGALSVNYLLRTGASWKGTIGKVNIRVYQSDGFAYPTAKPDKWSPAPFERVENGWSLELENFEPAKQGNPYQGDSDDIHVLFLDKSNGENIDFDKMVTMRDNPAPKGLALALTTDTEDATSDITSSPEAEEAEATRTSSKTRKASVTALPDRPETASGDTRVLIAGLGFSGLVAVGIFVALLIVRRRKSG